MNDDESRFHPDHLADNLGVPDDAGPNAERRIIEDAAQIGGLERYVSQAWCDAFEIAAKVAEIRIRAGRADTVPSALRDLIIK